MDSNVRVGSIGISFWGLLTIVFIALKLMHYIEWSWVWVLSPVWIPLIIGVAILVIFICIMLIMDKWG